MKTIRFRLLICIVYGVIVMDCKRRNQFNFLTQKQVVLKDVGQCDGKDELPIYVAPMEIVQEEKYKFYTYGEVVIKEDFPNGFRSNVDVKQCPADFNLLKCTTYVNNLGTDQLCEILKLQSDAYSPYLDAIKPRPFCPLKKGVYKIDRIPVTNNLLRYIPLLSVSNWYTNVTGFIKHKMVACFTIQVSIKPRRV